MTRHRLDPPEANEPTGWQEDTPYPAVPEPDFAVRRITLIVLLGAAVVLPFLYAAATAYSDFRTRVSAATDATTRTVRIAEEHALKVFDLNETLDARVDDLVRGLGDEKIRAAEADIHDKLQRIGGGYPQVASISIFGPQGMLVANSRYYPAPRASIAGRDDFVGIRGGRILEHVSKTMTWHAGSGEAIFNTGIARHNTDGSFAGLVSVALRRSYFESFYRELLGADSRALTMSLVRADGAVLATYPPRAEAAPPPALVSSLEAGAKAGVLRVGSSPETGSGEILAFRRVGAYPVYVTCAYNGAVIWADWYHRAAIFAASIFAPSIVLWLVLGLSLRRLSAEEAAWMHWQAEASMRRSIETAYRQSRKMEALGNLVGSVAHDFNNLLMIVATNVQIARRRGAANIDRELGAIERALKSGQSLTRQLLGVARKQPLRNETIDLARWMAASRELLNASLGAKVSLVIDIPPQIWPIEVDNAELELALINIAVNARDAMPNGGRFAIRANNVKLERESGFALAGEFVQISLEDTGTGMSAEVLSHAFEPLYTTKPQGMGTGLGLPQVFAFCERSGGLATIESKLGEGTAVRLYLPRASAPPPPEAVAEPRTATADAIGGLRMLLVEDNDEVAAGTEALLRMMGHEVTCVFNADAAMQLLENAAGGRFDAIISDIHMPGTKNGIDLAETAQAMVPPLPVILITGYAQELDRARNVKARVLSKPFDIAVLETMLQGIRSEREQSLHATGTTDEGGV
ncbi:ATP-binding protein [Trinickia caryophylli]|uniref:histidine kinase n=1 Tax=Trinickia caryophylli TaxID=28094 RepID=A0A1X7G4K0_TRICW|nr:hybrid sensor histidine kinase/response regulator [Trinickia caryophylli]PMS13778.1 hybrid sensor histidine kinase/response regulator [Trinickia caryophylli]TRX14277.1 response regulator [Trinickia caryophylli]WQE14108.1 response regulator [Trinickia caryophylli]SMF63798.1 Signal transduction histidine kinase [Trinickia caryophylli]GLU33398.1 hybrid sensor histidine kinase/response regulator [Trinickia caryophylli]